MVQKQVAGLAQEQSAQDRAARRAGLSLSSQQTRPVQTPGGHTKGDKLPRDPAPGGWMTRGSVTAYSLPGCGQGPHPQQSAARPDDPG